MNTIVATSALAAASVVPVIPAIAAPIDSALLDAAARLRAAWGLEISVCAREHSDAEFDAAYDASKRIVSEIEGMQATTLAGLQVKALAISWCCAGEPFAEEDATTDDRLVTSLLDDLMSMEVADA